LHSFPTRRSSDLASLVEEKGGSSAVADIVGRVHVVPEFLGNRAPFADPERRAIIAGLDLDDDVDSLVSLYLAGLCGLGYGARQIVNAQAEKGIKTDTIVVSGGATRSALVRQMLADATGLTVAASVSPEPVLLGSAMLGAAAAGSFSNLSKAMSAMSALGEVHQPNPATRKWHEARCKALELLQETGRKIG